MHIQIKIQEEVFKVSIGKGYNDWAWLSHYAARVYSKTIYPQGTYIPALLYIQTKSGQFHPHPREKIKFYLQSLEIPVEQVTAVVKIRKANHLFTEYEKKWEMQAFGEDRYFAETKFSYKVSNLNKKKDYYFKVKVYFSISEDVRHYVDEKKYPNCTQLKLEERTLSPTESVFEGVVKLPYGTISHRLYYIHREFANEEYVQHELSDNKIKREDFKVNTEPKQVLIEYINNLVSEDMKISESINKSLQEKELEAKKRNTNSSLCCFTFQQLWANLQQNYSKQLCLQDYEESTKQRIKIVLEKSLSELYEIFFYYFIVQNQQRDKKEDLSITYQHIMHFLRDYQVFGQTKDLLNFIQFYNGDYKFRRLEDTLDVNNYGVKFPQFVAILLRSIQFVQTSTFMMKGETFDSAVIKILEKILEIDAEEDQFTQFRRNIRENAKIISFMRSYSENIKRVYCHQANLSIQNSQHEYVLMKEQIKRMLQISGLTDKNTDLIVEECFNELKLREDGIFYYQFLNVIQWLAMATIASQKEEKDFDNDDEEALLIVEKIKYMIDKVISIL